MIRLPYNIVLSGVSGVAGPSRSCGTSGQMLEESLSAVTHAAHDPNVA
jgi:hypothetical protein